MVLKSEYSYLKIAENIADKIISSREQVLNLKSSNIKKEIKRIKKEVQNGSLNKSDIIFEVYRLADLVIKRSFGFYLHKVQLMGALILDHGDIAEMKTGEGKTITATLPAILNSLIGKGVHVITVNDYLAKRDFEEMKVIYESLGLTVGCVIKETPSSQKKHEYSMDITYVTNSELGFDYLRDNMVLDYSSKVQRGLYFCIIDEADSILIDEARTPLIISGGQNQNLEIYKQADLFAKQLVSEDYTVDEETKSVFLNHSGVEKAEKNFNIKNLYDLEYSELNHRIHQAMQANYIFTKDVDYAVKDGKVEIIDVFTGRILVGRQYSNGLHQALQAKEKVKIDSESQVQATITYQNLFRLYRKISGMTGTAKTEEEEFLKIYNSRVFVIPTNKPIVRVDEVDAVYSTKEHKWNAVISKIIEVHKTGQPILVGTRSVHDSELVSRRLIKEGVKHEVLNAKNHSREAEIIENAGQLNALTISTNMAGRGTDIKLGKGVIEVGGLFVIGTERHEAERIDNQLKGRSGRQGDIGRAKFYISLYDEIMIRSGAEKIKKFFNDSISTPLESKRLTKAIKSCQKRIEGSNFDARKSVIEYDNILNEQRKLIYRQRDNFLQEENMLSNVFVTFIHEVANEIVKLSTFYKGGKLDYNAITKAMQENLFGYANFTKKEIEDKDMIDIANLIEDKMIDKFNELYDDWDDEKINKFLSEVIILNMDNSWKIHLNNLTRLRSSIQYRQYAQKNPIQIYIEEANELFKIARERMYHGSVRFVLSKKAVPKEKQPTRRFHVE